VSVSEGSIVSYNIKHFNACRETSRAMGRWANIGIGIPTTRVGDGDLRCGFLVRTGLPQTKTVETLIEKAVPLVAPGDVPEILEAQMNMNQSAI
jgi:hypothetical protein